MNSFFKDAYSGLSLNCSDNKNLIFENKKFSMYIVQLKTDLFSSEHHPQYGLFRLIHSVQLLCCGHLSINILAIY